MVELRHLRYFVAVAEDLSFTSAARRLNVSQPPLSQQIRQLEDELGTSLFKRTSRRVELTPAGAALLVRARAILAELDQAAEEVKVIGRGHVGTLDIGMTGSVLLGRLAALVRDFSAAFPQIIVRLHELPPTEQHAALVARRTDISFLRRPPDDSDLEQELGWREQVGLALPVDHPFTTMDRVSLIDLREEVQVFLRLNDSRFAQYLWTCCVEAGFTPKISQQAVESYSLISLVAAGFGIALVPERVQSLSHPGVVYRKLHGTGPAADVMMLYRPDRSPVLETFLRVARIFLRSPGSGGGATPKPDGTKPRA